MSVPRCTFCGSQHNHYRNITEALNVAMDEANDCDCRGAAQKWIIKNWNAMRRALCSDNRVGKAYIPCTEVWKK